MMRKTLQKRVCKKHRKFTGFTWRVLRKLKLVCQWTKVLLKSWIWQLKILPMSSWEQQLQKKKSLWKNMMRKTLKKRVCKKHRKILSLTVFNDDNISLTRLLRMREHAYSPSAALLAEFSTQSQASSSHLQLSGAVAKRQRPTTTQCHLSQRPKPEPCYHIRWEDSSPRRSNKTRRRTCTETTPHALHYLTHHCSKIGTGTFCACVCVCVCVCVSLSLSLSLSQKLQIWTVLDSNSSKFKNFFPQTFDRNWRRWVCVSLRFGLRTWTGKTKIQNFFTKLLRRMEKMVGGYLLEVQWSLHKKLRERFKRNKKNG